MNDREVGQVERAVEPYVDAVTRFGLAAKGLVAVVIGVMAVRFVIGLGGGPAGPVTALRKILYQPFGRILLAVMALGIFAYALWKEIQAFVDPENKGNGIKGIAERAAYGVTGLSYVLLGWVAVKLTLRSGGGGGGTSTEDLAAKVLSPHLGRWAVGIAGAVIIVSAIFQLRLMITAAFAHILKHDISSVERRVIVWLGRVGYGALAIVSGAIGYSLIQVALQFDPGKAEGWKQVLTTIHAQSHGRWLLGLVGLGLAAYGLYFMVLAKYRRIWL